MPKKMAATLKSAAARLHIKKKTLKCDFAWLTVRILNMPRLTYT